MDERERDLSDEPYDGGGRITISVKIDSGPSWDDIWHSHVKRNWLMRDEQPHRYPSSWGLKRRLTYSKRDS